MAIIQLRFLMQMSVSNVFFAVVGLSSIVLTVLLVINETSRVHPQLGRSSANQLTFQRYPEPLVSIFDDHVDYATPMRYNNDTKIFRSSWAIGGPLKKGWKVLPGNVVVHDGGRETTNPHDFHYILNPGTAVCAGLEANASAVLVFVESDANNGDRRKTIRETWALPMLQKAMNFRVVFGLAMPRRKGGIRKLESNSILDEFYEYGDIIQENFTEGFKHLGLKSIMGLKWTKDFCSPADYYLKTDDDILVHVPNLMKILSGEPKNTDNKLLLCHLNKSRRIIRHGTSFLKYRVSPGELPGAFFPSYCGGFAYAMSRSAVIALYEASLTTPYFFIEDVFVTGFCRHKAGVVARDHESIALKPNVTAGRAPCDFAEGRVTSQELDIIQMKEVWRTLNTRGFFCPVPIV